MLTDAVQVVGKVPVNVEELAADYLVIGAHKFHGPLGAAALWIRQGAPFEASMLGGSQERRRRAGTENVPALVGFGAAARLAREELTGRAQALAELRDRFETGLSAIPDARIHCAAAPRLPHTSHVAFPGAEGESLTIRLDLAGFAVSTGAACSSGVVEPSHTLLSIGLSREEALSSIRVSFGITNRVEEVDRFLMALAENVAALRQPTGDQSSPAPATDEGSR
jgi:cysteine desulfurase